MCLKFIKGKMKYSYKELYLGPILLLKNDDLFKMYMDSPCGRLLVKEVLKDFGIEDRYTSLLKYKNNRFACKPNQKDAYFYFCEDAYEKLISGKLKKE